MDCGGLVVVVVWATFHEPRTYLQVSYVKLSFAQVYDLAAYLSRVS